MKQVTLSKWLGPMLMLASAGAVDAADGQATEIEALRERVRLLEERLGSPDASPPSAETRDAAAQSALTDRISFAGDARYRAESIGVDNAFHERQRVRARVGVTAQITETTRTGLRLSTGEGDPRSGHLTFSGGYSRRSVGADLAYLEWRPLAHLSVSAGKFAYPNWQPSQSVFIGGDFNPEGWSSAYRSDSGWFGNAHSFWLQVRNDDADSTQNGVQLGFATPQGDSWQLTVAGDYTDFDNVSGQRPFLDGVNAYGNSVTSSGVLATDFDIVGLAAQLVLRGYRASITFFTHGAQNTAADADDTAYAAGFTIGGAEHLAHWRLGYQYARIEKDALFGQLMDGDFGGGSTDTRGHAFRVSYRPDSRWSSSLSYLRNSIAISSAAPRAFDLLQLDIDFAY